MTTELRKALKALLDMPAACTTDEDVIENIRRRKEAQKILGSEMTPLKNPLITNEMVEFRLIQTPCCGHSLCWLNPRLPTYCPECGHPILVYLSTQQDKYIAMRANAWLRCEEVR